MVLIPYLQILTFNTITKPAGRTTLVSVSDAPSSQRIRGRDTPCVSWCLCLVFVDLKNKHCFYGISVMQRYTFLCAKFEGEGEFDGPYCPCVRQRISYFLEEVNSRHGSTGSSQLWITMRFSYSVGLSGFFDVK